jgi:hypothetical protein
MLDRGWASYCDGSAEGLGELADRIHAGCRWGDCTIAVATPVWSIWTDSIAVSSLR